MPRSATMNTLKARSQGGEDDQSAVRRGERLAVAVIALTIREARRYSREQRVRRRYARELLALQRAAFGVVATADTSGVADRILGHFDAFFRMSDSEYDILLAERLHTYGEVHSDTSLRTGEALGRVIEDPAAADVGANVWIESVAKMVSVLDKSRSRRKALQQ